MDDRLANAHGLRPMGAMTLRKLEKKEELEVKVAINQIFGHLLRTKNEMRCLENIFLRLKKQIFHIRGVFHNSCKRKYLSIYI